MKTNVKKISRIQTLLDRLNNEVQVPARELETVLSPREMMELNKSWAEEKAMGRIKKPPEIVKYGELLKTACMYYGKMEYHHTGRRKNTSLSKKFSDKADSAFEKAIEYIREMVSTDRELAIWLDRDVFGETSWSPVGIPRIVGSRNFECLNKNKKPYRGLSKKQLKITFLEIKLKELSSGPLEVFMEDIEFHIQPKKVRNVDFSSFQF